jgi:glutathione peroxidase-family protein
MASFHDFEMTSITGDPVSLSNYEGTVCLVVNVASK